MRFSILYNVFIRDLRKQQKRITLTLVALGWGTISIMLLLGFGEGLQQQLTVNMRGMGSGIGVIWGGQTSMPFNGLGKGRPIWLRPGDPAYLKKSVPSIKHIGGEYHRWGSDVRYGDNILSEHIAGVPAIWEDIRNFIPIQGGRMINEIDVAKKRRVAFLGYDCWERLFVHDQAAAGDDKLFNRSATMEGPGPRDAVGKQILINGAPFTVIGVMVDKMQMSSYTGQDRSTIAIPNTTFEALYGDPYLDNIVVMPHDVSRMDEMEKGITAALASKYRFHPEDEDAVSMWDVAATQRETTNMLLGIKIFLGIIGGLTLLIAGVGVANIMYVSIKERTREIGVKMALGARKIYILSQFLVEALIITFLGGFGGMAVVYVATEAFKRVPMESDVMEFMGRPTISFEIGITVIIILGVMGLLSGFFPALRAASVNPVESLRYE